MFFQFSLFLLSAGLCPSPQPQGRDAQRRGERPFKIKWGKNSTADTYHPSPAVILERDLNYFSPALRARGRRGLEKKRVGHLL